MVDAAVLEAAAERRVGSSPTFRTKYKEIIDLFFLLEKFMHWIIQNNLNFEEGIESLKNYLSLNKIPLTLVNLNKKDDLIYDLKGDILNINEKKSVIGFGSYKLCRLLKEQGFYPASFLNDNFSYDILKDNYSAINLLNGDIIIEKIKDLVLDDKPLFIRPLKDNKLFTGRVFKNEDFNILKYDMSNTALEEYVILSEPKLIESEYRLFIVDKKIVSGSLYKLRGQVIWSDFIDSTILNFANEMISKWSPAIAYTLDIALINKEPKIIEINNINSAGLYKSDVSKIVDAIESLNY
jgi:hypothetical protein